MFEWKQQERGARRVDLIGTYGGGVAATVLGQRVDAARSRAGSTTRRSAGSYGPWAREPEPASTFTATRRRRRRRAASGTYSIWGLNGAYTGFKNLTLTLGVKNLFDTRSAVHAAERRRSRSATIRRSPIRPDGSTTGRSSTRSGSLFGIRSCVTGRGSSDPLCLSRRMATATVDRARLVDSRTGSRGTACTSDVVTLLLLIVALASPVVAAQDKIADVTELNAVRTAIRSDKRAFVASTLKLTDAQAKKFWPIYDAYQRSLDSSNRQRVVALEQVILRDKVPSELYARRLASDLLAADEAELKARRTMQKAVMRALPAAKAARYLQLESKIRAVQAYDIASAIPLVR